MKSAGSVGTGRQRDSQWTPTTLTRILACRVWIAYAVLAVLVAGCLLFTADPSDDTTLTCTVTVNNPDAAEASGVEGGPLATLSSSGTGFILPDGSERFVMSLADEGVDCPGTFTSLEAADTFWRLAVEQRIQELAADQTSIFGLFPTGWCEVPGTLGCTDTGMSEGFCRPFAAVTNTVPLPTCPVPPAPVECLQITCADTQCGLPRISFDDAPVGESTRRTLVLTNQCAEGGLDVEITGLDGLVRPLDGSLLEADFEIFFAAQSACDPPTVALSPGESCSFDVVFAPETPGMHRGETSFITALRQITLEFEGNAQGGSLEFVPNESVLCMDDLDADGCTDEAQVDVTNLGPGWVNINDVRLDPAQGFELLNLPELPRSLEPNEALSVRSRWCGSPDSREETSLIIDSDDRGQPSFMQSLLRDPCGCEPDPTLIAAYGFEGEGDVIQDVTGNRNGILVPPAQRNTGGRLGAAVEFPGDGGHINLGDELTIAGDALTIALWFNADDFGNDEARAISKSLGFGNQDHDWMLGTVESGQELELRFRLKTDQGGTNQLVSTGAELQTNVWTHVTVTYDGAQMVIYKDGAELASEAKAGELVSTPNVEAWIGDNPPDGARSFDGLIDEVRIYSRALAVPEIQQIMNCALSPLPSGP